MERAWKSLWLEVSDLESSHALNVSLLTLFPVQIRPDVACFGGCSFIELGGNPGKKSRLKE